MKAPLFWLRDWVEINDKPEVLAEKLLLSGTKVESIDTVSGEVVLNLEITSNRPDCLSLYGIAREISALTSRSLNCLHFPLSKEKKDNFPLKIIVAQKDLCLAYSSIVLDNIVIKQSPDWLKKRLECIDIRSINNIVDVTNYVMYEYGIPIHAFDYDKIIGHQITIRASKEGEKVTPLDGKERLLQANTIIIEDAEKLIDLAGIMGGQNSEISDSTRRVFLHVPIYNPILIRRTSKYLGLRTEAVPRYEKKLDLTAGPYTMEKAADLTIELAGGTIASPIYRHEEVEYVPPTIELTDLETKNVVGIQIPPNTVEKILKSLEFTVKTSKNNAILVTPPAFRRDVEIKEDVIEEIARIYGYNKLPLTIPAGPIPMHEDSFKKDWLWYVKTLLVGLGATEVYGFTMMGKDQLTKTHIDSRTILKVLHPMSKDFEYMRPTLISGLLSMVKHNLYHADSVSLFEIGTIFKPKTNDLPHQPLSLSLVTTENYQEVKGKVDALLKNIGISVKFKPASKPPPYFSAPETAEIVGFGYVGTIDSQILFNFGIDKPIWAVELDAESIQAQAQDIYYHAIPTAPPIIEDLTFIIIKPKTYIGEIIEAITHVDTVLSNVELIRKYQDTRTFRLTYQHPTQTLSSKKIESVREKIIETIEAKFAAKIKR